MDFESLLTEVRRRQELVIRTNDLIDREFIRRLQVAGIEFESVQINGAPGAILRTQTKKPILETREGVFWVTLYLDMTDLSDFHRSAVCAYVEANLVPLIRETMTLEQRDPKVEAQTIVNFEPFSDVQRAREIESWQWSTIPQRESLARSQEAQLEDEIGRRIHEHNAMQVNTIPDWRLYVLLKT